MAQAQHAGGGGSNTKPKTTKRETPVTTSPTTTRSPSSAAPAAAPAASTIKVPKPTFGQRVGNAINNFANKLVQSNPNIGQSSGVNNPSTWAGLVSAPATSSKPTTSVGQAFKPATTQTTKPAAATNPGQIQIAKPPKVGASNESSYTFLTPGGSGASAVSSQAYTAKFNENADDYIGTMKRIFNGVGDQNGIDDPDFLRTQLSNGDALIAELEKNPNGFDKDYIERSIASIQNSNNLIRERLMILQLASSPNPEVSSKAQEIIRKYANYDPTSNIDEATGKLISKYEPANADWVLKTVAGTAPQGNRGTSSVISSVLESSTMSPKDKYNAILKSYQTDWASFEKVPKETGLDSYLTWQDETYKLLGEDYAASAEYIQNFADQLIEEYGVDSNSEEIQQLRGIVKSYEAMAKGATLDDFFSGFADEHEFNQWYLAEAAKGNNRDDFVGFDVDKVRDSITDIENRIAIKQQELDEVRSSSKGFGKSGMESVPKIQELENELLTLKDRRDDYSNMVSAYETAIELDSAIDSGWQYQQDVNAKTDELIKLEDAAAKSKAAFDKARMITREGLTAQEFLDLEQKVADDAAAVETARKELSHMHDMQALATSGLSRDAAVLSTLSGWTDNRTFGQQVADWTKATKADLKTALTDGALSWKDLGAVTKNAAVNAYNIADLRLVQTMDFLVGEDSPLTGHGTAIGELRLLGSVALEGLGINTRFADDDRIGYFAEQAQKDQAAIEQNRKNIENAVSNNKTVANIANLLSDTFSCAFDLIPMTVMAVATGGASAAPTLAAGTTEYLTYVSSINTGSELSRMATIMTQDLAATAKNPMYWTSFASVAGPSYQDALDQGLSKDVATTYALINSAINAKIEIGGGLETFPERIRDGVYKTDKGFWAASLDAVKELFTESGFDEAKEELWQGAAERALMAAAKGDNLTWTDTGEEHTTALFSTTAQDAIINPKLMAKEAGAGYLGGVLLGGGQQILNSSVQAVSEAKLNNRFAQEYNTIEKQQQFIADSKYLGNTSEKVMAADAQLNPKEGTATAKQLSGKELLAIARENEKASAEAKVGLAAKRMGLSTEDIEMVKRDFSNSDAQEANKFIKGMADMYRWAINNGEIESASRYLPDTDYLSNEVKSHIYNMGQKIGNPNLNLTKTETFTVGNITGTITGLKTVGNELRVQLTDAEGNAREVAVSGETMAQLPIAIQDLWKEFGDKAGMLYEAYDPSISFRQYRNDVRALMSAASNSTQSWNEFSQTEGAAKLAPSLSPELKQQLWDSVQKTNRHTAVTKSQITRANKAADRTENEVQAGEVKGKKFSVTLKDAKGKDIHIDLAKYQVTKAQKGSKEAKALKVAEAAAKVFGINIYLYNAPNSGIAGAFVGEDTIYLNMQDVDAKGDYIIMKSLSHELTHFIQKNSIRDYIALKNFMVEKLLQKTEGMTYEQLLQDKINREGLTGPDAIARAEDEIVADGCEMMLKNSKMFEELATQNMTLAKRIQKWLNNVKKAIRELYGDQSATFEEAEYMKQFIDEQQKLWDRGLKNAVLNRDAQRKAEAKKNNASAFRQTSKETQFSRIAFGLEDINKEQRNMLKLGGIEIVSNEAELLQHIKNALSSDQDLKKNICIGAISESTKAKMEQDSGKKIFRKTGQWVYIISYDDIRHISDHYPNPEEIVQVVHTLCGMLNTYDYIEAWYTTVNEVRLELKKRLPDADYLTINIASKNRRALDLLTIYITKKNNRSQSVPPADLNAGTKWGSTPDNPTISQSETKSNTSPETEASKDLIVAPGAKPVNETKAATSEDVTIVTEKGRQYSIRSMRHDIADGKMFEDLKAYVGYSNKDINKLKQDLTALTNYMAQYADILDMNETYNQDNRPYKPYKPNSDKLYVLSLDFSTLCRKRLLTQHVMEELQTTLTDSKTGKLGRVLTAEEQLAIRDMLNEYAKQEKALKVACAMCYVEAARMKSPVQIEKALGDMRGLMVDYFAKRSPTFKKHIAELQAQWKADHGYDRDATKKSMKSKDQTAFNKYSHEQRALYQPTAEETKIIDAAVAMPRTTFLKASNLTELAENYPDIYTAYTNKLREATHSKGLETDIPYYYGDSKGVVSDSFIQAVNDENGMRFSSWSDFQMKHMLDMMTAVIELSTRKCAMHGYTKFLEQVRIFGKTGMMFNMSGVPSGNGFTADGGLAFSPTESVLVYGQDNEYDAVAAREQFPETAGLQCIGISNAHIKALLDSDIIDYVIPYHTSGMNAGLRKMAGINNWSDFQGFQEAKIDDRIKPADSANYDEATWHKEPVFSEFFNAALDEANGYTKGEDGVTTMRRAADLYKQMCRDRGMKPKFSWGNSRVDADFSNEANYWKLLIDRKMINQKTGELIQQKPVRPDFDFDAITKEVKAEVDSYDAGLETKALDYIKEHLDELPGRVRDLKKSGTVKKLEAQTKPADMQRHLDNLFNSMMTSDTGTQEAENRIQFSFVRPSDDLIQQAEALEAQGKDAVAIWGEIGLMKGPDGAWRTELDDSRIRFYKNGNAKSSGHGHMLDDYLEFPELYEQYPALKNIGVTENPEAPNIRTSFDPATGTININPNAHMSKDVKRLAVLHEVQHMIQRLEGWAADEYGYSEQEAKLVEARHNLSKAQRRAMLPKLLSTIDKTYMPMAKSGQEKAAQQLVDDAAHAAGYTEKVYHGSVNFGDHTVLETSGIDSTSDGGTYEWSPYFATDKLEIAKTYSGRDEARQIGKTSHKGNKTPKAELKSRATLLTTDLFTAIHNRFPNLPDSELEAIQNYCDVLEYDLEDYIDDYMDGSTFQHHLNNISSKIFIALNDNKTVVKEEGLNWFLSEAWIDAQTAISGIINDAKDANTHDRYGNYQYWVNTENFLVVEADFHKWHDLTYPSTGETGLTTREIAKQARDDGYSGVKILNVYDIGPQSGSGPAGTVYIFFDPQTQVKSADPITYDDEGEIIPLSERFSPDNPDIRFSLMRRFPNERSFLDAYNNRLDEEFEGYVLSPAQERMVIPKIENDAQADYYNNLPKYAEDIAAGMLPFVPGDAIPDYDRSLIKYSSEWYKKNGLPIPAKRTPYALFEPTLVDDGSVVERDELPFSIVPQHERTMAEQLAMDQRADAAQQAYFRDNPRIPDINRKVRPTLRTETINESTATDATSESPAGPAPTDMATPADVSTPAPTGAHTGARVSETPTTGPQKQSKFASNTLEGMDIWDEIGGRENTMDRNGEFLYNEVTERESIDAARQRLEADWGYWERDLMGEYTSPTADREWTGKDLDTAMAIFRQKRIDANRNQDQSLTPEERYADVDAWLQRIREKATAGGQLIQAFAKYSRTPEGVLIQAGRDLAANNKLTRDQRNEILNKMINFAMTLDALREAGDTGDNSSLIELIKQQAEMRGTPVSQRIENGLKKEQFQYLYDVALTQLAQIAADYRPNSIGKKLSTYQTIAHLLNLRTGTRNVVANMAFRTVDRIANMIAAPMDAFVGKITGNRTVGWKQLGRLSGEVRKTEHERGRRASIEASLDVDPYNGKDKYGTSRRTWKMKDGPGARVMSTLEKWMAYELNVTDEISKGIILGEVMESLSPFIENNLLSEDEAIAMAKQEMLYRTFQDDNWANGLLGAIKNALNVIGTGSTNGKMIGSLPVHDFGLGDIVTKYVQVPGSLIMRMIEYSPIGTIKAVADMANIFTAYNQLSRSNTLEDAKQAVADLRQQLAEAKAAGEDTTELKAQLKEATSNYRDVKNRTGDIRAKAFLKDQGQYTKSKVAINNEQARMNALQAQRRAMLQLGRSLTGSGLIALFAALAKAGLLRRDDDDEDKDIRALNTSAGLSGTQLNLSALMRAASGESNWSEWLDGDKLMDIGFLEPLNGLMTIGTIVAKNNDDLISRDTMNDTLAGLMENIAELPVMQTLGTIQSSIQNLQYDAESENATQSIAKDVMSVAIDVARSSASGFIPAPVRQAAQATDEYARDMYQGDTGAEKFVDSLKSSIPGLRQTLPQKLDNFGNPRTTEADPFMRAMNAFVNPGNLRTYKSADLANELNRLYDATGKSGILPKRYAPYSINEGPGYQLTADEKRVYQITRGQTADNLLRDLFESQAYQTATDEQRAEWAKDVVSYADYVAKQEFLNNRNYLDEKGEGYSSRAKEEMKEALAKGVPLDTYLKYVDAIDRRYTVATYDYEARNSTLEAEYRAGNINDEQFIQLYDYTTNSTDTTPEKLTAASEAGIAPPDYLIYKAEINDNPDFNRTKANYGKGYDTANKKAVSAYIWSVAKTDEQAEILWLLRYKESTLNKLYQYKPKS